MTTSTEHDSQNESRGKPPDLVAWHIPERDNAPWTRIGAAWAHGDGEGYSLQLDLMPVATGKLVLRRNAKDG